MKTKLFLSILIVFSIAITYSCKKETIQTPTVYNTYMPLKVGNYWIYEEVLVDSNGNETSLNRIDSNYVEKDTLLNGYTYFKVHMPNYVYPDYYQLLRDSIHYLVNSNGNIIFSSQDFTNTLNSFAYYVAIGDTISLVKRKMESTQTTINVVAGTYLCYNAKETYHMYPGWNTHGDYQYSDFYYAKDIGLIRERLPFFVSFPENKQKKLIRYHLN